jgi:glucose/mannose-6-phosphate isomerase
MAPGDAVDESVLDDPDRLRAADPGDCLRVLATAGATVRRTMSAAAEAGAPTLAADGLPRAVVLLGGGSTLLAAEAMVDFAGPRAAVPIIVYRGAELPRWIGATDLVIAASSNAADPTVAPRDQDAGPARLLAAAGGRGARVAAIGPPGSPIAVAVGSVRGIFIESAAPEPFWPAFSGLLCLLRETGLITAPDELLELLIERMDDRAIQARPDSETFLNPAKSLALRLSGSIPMVGASTPVGRWAARRFIAALGTLAGYPAVAFDPAYLGGGLGGPAAADDFFRDRVDEPEQLGLHAVLLRDEGLDPVADRMRDLVTGHGVGLSELELETGPDPVRFARAVAELDFVAAYLAVLLGVDPSRALRYGAGPHGQDQGER